MSVYKVVARNVHHSSCQVQEKTEEMWSRGKQASLCDDC